MLKRVSIILFFVLSLDFVLAMDRFSSEFWDTYVYPTQKFAYLLYRDIDFSDKKIEEVCGYLNPDAMTVVLEKVCDIGKRFIKEHNNDAVKKTLIILLLPNHIFNTEGSYEDLLFQFTKKCKTFEEFAKAIEEISMPFFWQLWHAFCTENATDTILINETKLYLQSIDATFN